MRSTDGSDLADTPGYAELRAGEANRGAGRARAAAVRSAGARRQGSARALRRRDVGVIRRDDRRADRPARRLREVRRHAQPADLAHEHRRLLVERGVSRAAGDHRPPRDRRAARPHAEHARANGARRRRPVLQLVRHPHRRRLARVAGRRPGDADPVIGRQRLAGGRPARRGESGARAARAGADAVGLDGLRLLLPARPQPDPLPLRALDRRGGLLLRHDRLREPHRDLRRRRAGSDPAAPVLRHAARVQRLRSPRRSRSASHRATSASPSSRGRSRTRA